MPADGLTLIAWKPERVMDVLSLQGIPPQSTCEQLIELLSGGNLQCYILLFRNINRTVGTNNSKHPQGPRHQTSCKGRAVDQERNNPPSSKLFLF